MLTIEKLEQYGANTAEGLGRCFGNESLYFRLVGMIPGEANFPKLQESVKAGDLDTGFEAAHALMGVVSNLALSSMLRPVEEITEKLRAREQADYTDLLAQIEERRAALEELCK